MPWLCAHTKPNAEFKAERLLREHFDDVYIPRFKRQRRHAGKTDIVERAVFPRYIFILVSSTQRWRDICTTPFVDHLICNGDTPCVSDRVVEALQKRPQCGDKVRIVDGMFSPWIGTLESMSARERVIVLLDLLGQKTSVELNSNQITAA